MEDDIQNYLPTVCLGIFFNNHNLSLSIFQGILVPKIPLGLFLTLSIRNGPNLESYPFQLYISLTRQCFKFRICSKMENLTLSWKRSRDLYKKNSYHNFGFFKSLKLEIVVLVMLNKILIIVLLSTFTLEMGRDPKNQVYWFVPISNTQCQRLTKC